MTPPAKEPPASRAGQRAPRQSEQAHQDRDKGGRTQPVAGCLLAQGRSADPPGRAPDGQPERWPHHQAGAEDAEPARERRQQADRQVSWCKLADRRATAAVVRGSFCNTGGSLRIHRFALCCRPVVLAGCAAEELAAVNFHPPLPPQTLRYPVSAARFRIWAARARHSRSRRSTRAPRLRKPDVHGWQLAASSPSRPAVCIQAGAVSGTISRPRRRARGRTRPQPDQCGRTARSPRRSGQPRRTMPRSIDC